MAVSSLFLVGPMGAGKSTLGRLLAETLNKTFVDSDRCIEQRAGANIPWIFDLEGEAGFRDRETQMLDELTQQPHLVLATGGGAVVRAENRRMLASRGVVVYLRTQIDTQLARTAKDKNRPLLQKDNPRAILVRLLEERAPLYEALADIVVDTDHGSPRALADYIVQEYRAHHENA